MKAFDEKLHRFVAIKLMSPLLAATSAPRKRFVREARSAAAVRHENVIAIYAVEDQPIPYLVMEYIAGRTLQQKLDATGPLELLDVLRIGRQIAAGLAAAHAMGLIHRDIKPGNILLEDGVEHVKITDFGLARAADDASITQSGFIAGTPMYMAPEQALGRDDRPAGRPVQPGQRALHDVQRPAAVPGREHDGRAQARRGRHAPPDPGDHPGGPGVALRADLGAARQEPGRPDRLGTRSGRPARATPGGASGLGEYPRGCRMSRGPTRRSRRRHRRSPKPARRIRWPRFFKRRWAVAAAVLVMLFGCLGLTEATGVTDFHGTVIRLFSPEGTLVVEVDDPAVSVKIDGSDIVITGAGVKEIRLQPGRYTVEASKNGKLVQQELVNVTKNGRQVVRVSRETPTACTRRPRRGPPTCSRGSVSWPPCRRPSR